MKIKPLSKSAVPQAIAKVEIYRNLKEPGEAESICQDILLAVPANQLALRYLGVAITDQFTGDADDRCADAERVFGELCDPYEQHYYTGILFQRRAKAQLRAGRPLERLVEPFRQAMHHFQEAEKLRPPQNDDALLRWNRCVRILDKLPNEIQKAVELSDDGWVFLREE